MASAVSVVKVEPQYITWLEVEDSDGKIWRYAKGDLPRYSGTVHIHVPVDGTLQLLAGGDGKPLLHQDGPGLPAIIGVSFAEKAGDGPFPVKAVWTAGGGTYEYTRQ